jgi:hypothetical protein
MAAREADSTGKRRQGVRLLREKGSGGKVETKEITGVTRGRLEWQS